MYKRIMIILPLLLLFLTGCTGNQATKTFPPPDGYSSWEQYYEKQKQPEDQLTVIIPTIPTVPTNDPTTTIHLPTDTSTPEIIPILTSPPTTVPTPTPTSTPSPAPKSTPTEVEGDLSQDTVWTKENSPYLLTDTVKVCSQVTLTIEPGVTITKPSRGDMFFVMGTIYAHGTSQEPIVIDGGGNSNIVYTTPIYGYGDFQHCIIKNGYALWSSSGYLNLRYSEITNVSVKYTADDNSIIKLDGKRGESNIEFNTFVNTGGISSYTHKFSLNIQNNLFEGLRSPITHLGEGDLTNPPKQILVKYNSFINAKGLVLRLNKSMLNLKFTIEAAQNYWGTEDTEKISEMIYDKMDSPSIATTINFLPVLKNPHRDTPSLSHQETVSRSTPLGGAGPDALQLGFQQQVFRFLELRVVPE